MKDWIPKQSTQKDVKPDAKHPWLHRYSSSNKIFLESRKMVTNPDYASSDYSLLLINPAIQHSVGLNFKTTKRVTNVMYEYIPKDYK